MCVCVKQVGRQNRAEFDYRWQKSIINYKYCVSVCGIALRPLRVYITRRCRVHGTIFVDTNSRKTEESDKETWKAREREQRNAPSLWPWVHFQCCARVVHGTADFVEHFGHVSSCSLSLSLSGSTFLASLQSSHHRSRAGSKE